MRTLITASFALSYALLIACSGPIGDDDEGQSCTSDWSCENGICECADGTSCMDEDDCDTTCEVCE